VGEIEKDGISMTPDGFDFDNWWIKESKATWRSSSRELTDPSFFDWMVQLKSYCNAMETVQAKLQVLFINGNYRNSGPQYRAYLITFTEHDLRDSWRMVVKHKEKMIREGWPNNEQ
jgi:hypothetical protein